MSKDEKDIEGVLHFWFGKTSPIPQEMQRRWWKKSASFDELIQQKYRVLHQTLSQNLHDSWNKHAKGRLAMILVLDQFTRHLYRHSALAYGCDQRAQDVCLEGIERGKDLELVGVFRAFYYMPLMHAENLTYQDIALASFIQLSKETGPEEQKIVAGFVRSAKRHRSVIERFGRFPHRNALLARLSNAKEETFLRQPGSSF